MSKTSEDRLKRQQPDVPALFCVLAEAEVDYVVTGSAAAMSHGVQLVPGDLDITPALEVDRGTPGSMGSVRTLGARTRP
jgi:hypothetical protein